MALSALMIVLIALVALWNWNWFRPLVEARASAAVGRKVTIQTIGLSLGRVTVVTLRGVTITNPPGFAQALPLATIDKLSVSIDLLDYLQHQTLVLPAITITHPVISARQWPDGTDNYSLSPSAGAGGSNSAPPRIEALTITQGEARATLAKLHAAVKADFTTAQTTAQTSAQSGLLVAAATGVYAGQKLTAHFIGGALLTVSDPAKPYKIDLQVQNGGTNLSLVGSLLQPLTFGGADVKLTLAGPNMADLLPLIGVPLPATPPYKIAGMLDYAKRQIRFDHFTGQVGSSDLQGDISYTPATPRPKIVAELTSRRVDLADLGGFIGAKPGAKPAASGQHNTSEAGQLLPQTPFNLPHLKMADFDVHYRGEHIINRNTPLDNLVVHLQIIDGRITADPLNFAVGTGTIESAVDLDPVGSVLHTKANIDFRKIPLSRIMQSTHLFTGAGVIGGHATLTTTGNSIAQMLGRGNGGLQLFMAQGGDISALMVDLAGLQFGDGVLSALGIPRHTDVKCMITDFTLTNGLVDTKALLLATSEANILGAGTINLADEKLAMHLHTEATHFSIGSLSAPINIGGTLADPSILPNIVAVGAKTGAAIGLGILFPPLALLPTIRLGLGDKNACADTYATLAHGKT